MAAIYLDSSAIVKLAVMEPESQALRRHLRRRAPLVSSALARAEVLRAVLPGGEPAVAAGRRALALVDLIRVTDRVLNAAGVMTPILLGSLDAIHLATAARLGDDLREVVTYDDRLSESARSLGLRVAAPR